jgi:hypothetical protein
MSIEQKNRINKAGLQYFAEFFVACNVAFANFDDSELNRFIELCDKKKRQPLTSTEYQELIKLDAKIVPVEFDFDNVGAMLVNLTAVLH